MRITATEINPDFRPGVVIRYTPSNRHCREGIALINDAGYAVDTFWGSSCCDSHILHEDDLASAQVEFDTADFDELQAHAVVSRATWEKYAPADRARIPSQHGLQEALFIRRGAVTCIDTQIAAAQREVDDAEARVRFAQANLRGRKEDLARLVAEREQALAAA